MRITAAVLYDVNKPYSVETVELDPPKRGEVLIKVGAAGVCRSDLHFQKGEASIALPAVLGHEGSGTVAAVGEGVTLVAKGDRVILSFVPNCGHCASCESGAPHLCDEHARTTGSMPRVSPAGEMPTIPAVPRLRSMSTAILLVAPPP